MGDMSLSKAKNLYVLQDDSGLTGVYTSRARALSASAPGTVVSVVPAELLDTELGVTSFTPPTAAVVGYGPMELHDDLAVWARNEALGSRSVILPTASARVEQESDGQYEYPEDANVRDMRAEYEAKYAAAVDPEYPVQQPSNSFASGTIDLG